MSQYKFATWSRPISNDKGQTRQKQDTEYFALQTCVFRCLKNVSTSVQGCQVNPQALSTTLSEHRTFSFNLGFCDGHSSTVFIISFDSHWRSRPPNPHLEFQAFICGVQPQVPSRQPTPRVWPISVFDAERRRQHVRHKLRLWYPLGFGSTRQC